MFAFSPPSGAQLRVLSVFTVSGQTWLRANLSAVVVGCFNISPHLSNNKSFIVKPWFCLLHEGQKGWCSAARLWECSHWCLLVRGFHSSKPEDVAWMEPSQPVQVTVLVWWLVEEGQTGFPQTAPDQGLMCQAAALPWRLLLCPSASRFARLRSEGHGVGTVASWLARGWTSVGSLGWPGGEGRPGHTSLCSQDHTSGLQALH